MRQIEKDVFLNSLRNGVTVKQAAESAGVSRATVYRHRHRDPEFGVAWDDAYDEGADILEAEAHRRAVEGVEDFKMAGDKMIPVQRYSDTLLIFLLKARRPAKFRDNYSLELTGGEGGPVQFVEVNGDRVTGISAVFALARELGIGLATGVRDGLDAQPARDALPAAPNLLSDPRRD